MMREVAMSSMARVIFMVDWTDRIRRRTSRSCAPISSPRLLLTRELDAAGRFARRPRLLLEFLRRRPAELLQGLLLLIGQRLGRVVLQRRLALGGLEEEPEV